MSKKVKASEINGRYHSGVDDRRVPDCFSQLPLYSIDIDMSTENKYLYMSILRWLGWK
jgi:hypothetical protein